ncbi:MAG: Ig-like domain-containing protein [Telluria sp.]
MNTFKRYSKILLCSAGLLAAALVAGCGGSGDQGRDPILGLPAASLVSVAVTPATATVAIGSTQQFTATAVYADGTAQDVSTKAAWSSATTAVASVNASSGIAAGVSAGASIVSATFNGKNGSATLTVVPAKLVSIAVAPVNPSVNKGNTQQFTAMGTFDNNTTRDITAVSTFASASPAVASITASGLATGVNQGTSLITASSGLLSGSTMLTVTPASLMSLALTPQAVTLNIGASRQLTATATYSDGTTADVTASSQFTSSNTAAVDTSNAGMLNGVAAGSSVISASFGGKTATANANTTAQTLSSISISPASASINVGAKQNFVLTGTYSDNSTSIITNGVVWTSSATATATVLSTGAATGIAAGTTTITATVGTKSANATLNVTAVVTPPAAASVNLRSAASFAVLAGTSITNNAGGTTLITGDVGSPSQTTDPVLAAGFTNYKSGAILAGALADLQTAITDANSRTCDVSFAAGIDLGGLVLAPGVYCYAGSISITGTLKLNGPGVYIFRTATTLNTTANSIVQLTNGAAASDVTWVPVGPTTLGANSVFQGSILGQAAAITVGDNTTLQNGRVLTAAAVTLKNNQITK